MQTFFGSVKNSAFAKATARPGSTLLVSELSSDTNILRLCEKV